MPDLAQPAQPLTVFVSIGNTDNRLTQQQWACFYERCDYAVTGVIERHDSALYGRWVSPSTDPQQNACWAFSEPQEDVWHGEGGVREHLREWLAEIAAEYGQDSVAWTEGRAEFLPGVKA